MGSQPVWHMLLVSFGMALAIAVGKIVISVLSAYAVVFFRFPVPHDRVLADLHHADAAGRGAHHPDLCGDGRASA